MAEPPSGPGARGLITRRLLAIGAGALAAAAATAASAGVAQAQEPFHLELNRGELRLGSIEPLSPAFSTPDGENDRVALNGKIDPATGEFSASVETVAGGGNVLFYIRCWPAAAPNHSPQECSTSPLLALARVQEPVTGTLDEATGELEMTMPVDLRIATAVWEDLPPIEGGAPSCEFEDVQWNLSTSNAHGPLHGVPFLDGLEGAGAIVASWEDLPPMTPGVGSERCDELLASVVGEGGLLLGRVGPPSFHLRFTEGELQLGSLEPMVRSNGGAGWEHHQTRFHGDIDPATGEVTAWIQDVGTVPGYDGGSLFFWNSENDGPYVVVGVEEPATGSFDQATGELEMTMPVDLVVANPGSGLPPPIGDGSGPSCAFEDVEWQLSTSNALGLWQGAPFLDGLEGSGAIVASWEDLPAMTPAGGSERCDELLASVTGEGGLLLERERPGLDLSVTPPSQTVKQGERRVFTASIGSVSGTLVADGEVCITAPKKAFSVKVRHPYGYPGSGWVEGECVHVDYVIGSGSRVADFKVRALREAKPKSYPLTFEATGFSGEPLTANATATLKVKIGGR